MQTIRTKVLFISLLFPAVILPTMMQAAEIVEKKEKCKEVENKDFLKIRKVLLGDNELDVKEDELDRLINEGVNIDARNFRYDEYPTNLILATIFLDIPRARLLLNKDADVNKPNANNVNPLMIAIKSLRGSEEERLEFIKLLLESGAKDTGKNDDDESIWTLAKDKLAVMKLLTKHFN